MGTNYYLTYDACSHCGRTERLHIGKSSSGWCFALRVHSDAGIFSLSDWKDKWNREGSRIEDENGATISPEEMLDTITNRKGYVRNLPIEYSSWEEFHSRNSSRPGPNNLLRAKNGIAGPGTYDLIYEEFF